jgi:hypothetical protein
MQNTSKGNGTLKKTGTSQPAVAVNDDNIDDLAISQEEAIALLEEIGIPVSTVSLASPSVCWSMYSCHRDGVENSKHY